VRERLAMLEGEALRGLWRNFESRFGNMKKGLPGRVREMYALCGSSHWANFGKGQKTCPDAKGIETYSELFHRKK
jgi:hypothetical protein